MKRILVTGGTGLLGTALGRIASSGAYPEIELICVGSKDADLRNTSQVRELLAKHAPLHGIIHCAANVGGLFKNMRHPVEMYEDNIIMNTNILREAHAGNIENVCCVLSTCIFPDHIAAAGKVMTPDMLHDGPPHSSNEGYAYAKRMMEVHCRAYQRQYKRRYFCVVPTNIYGPYDNFDLADGHVIPALIHRAYLALKANAPFVVCGDGTPRRQFIYVDDLAHLILRTYLHHQDIRSPRMLCPPNSETTIANVASIIAKHLGVDKNMTFESAKSNGQKRKTALATNDPDMFYTPLQEGIQKTIDWFIQHHYHATSTS